MSNTVVVGPEAHLRPNLYRSRCCTAGSNHLEITADVLTVVASSPPKFLSDAVPCTPMEIRRTLSNFDRQLQNTSLLTATPYFASSSSSPTWLPQSAKLDPNTHHHHIQAPTSKGTQYTQLFPAYPARSCHLCVPHPAPFSPLALFYPGWVNA
jgi:hypothetical protein